MWARRGRLPSRCLLPFPPPPVFASDAFWSRSRWRCCELSSAFLLRLCGCAGHARSHAQLAGGGTGQVCVSRLLDPRPKTAMFVSSCFACSLLASWGQARPLGWRQLAWQPWFTPASIHATHSALYAQPLPHLSNPRVGHCCLCGMEYSALPYAFISLIMFNNMLSMPQQPGADQDAARPQKDGHRRFLSQPGSGGWARLPLYTLRQCSPAT